MSPIERSGGGGGSSAGGLVLLFQQTLSVAAASIDTGAGGIAAGHGDLFCSFVGRSTNGGGNSDNLQMQFNGDTAANYNWAWTRNQSGALSAPAGTANAFITVGQTSAGTADANQAGEVTWRIPAYDATTFFKTCDATGGIMFNAAGPQYQTQFVMGNWLSTTAITRIRLFLLTGPNFVAGSRMVIYGTQ
jgi:hypothetical protein